MQSFNSHTGLVVPFERENVDTDQIIPKQFLKRIERTGYGEFLFYDWRFQSNGKPNPSGKKPRDCANGLLELEATFELATNH